MWMLQGMLSDGRPLLMAVAPAASAWVKAATVFTMGSRLTVALDPSGALDALRDDAQPLPWRAFHLMAYMVRTRSRLLHRSMYNPDMRTPHTQQRMVCVKL